MIVADTNLIAHLLIKGQGTEEAMSILKRDSSWTVPLLWRSEFRSVLTLHVRQRLLALEQAIRLMYEAEQLLTIGEVEANSDEVLQLASISNCSAYDCEFVAVARRLRISLVTSDKEILSTFPEVAVSPSDFLTR